MASIDAEKIKTFFIYNRDRLIVLLCFLLTIGAFYFYFQQQKIGYSQKIAEVQDKLNQGDVEEEKKVEPEEVVEMAVDQPALDEYIKISKKNIFQNAPDRLAGRRDIEQKYEQAVAFMDGDNYANATRLLEEIMRRDPQEVMVDYPVRPSVLKNKIEEETRKNAILSIFGQAEDSFHQAEQLEKDGDLLKAQSGYEKSLASYQEVLETEETSGEKLVSAEIRTKAKNQIEEIRENISRLTQITFRQEIQGYFDQATQAMDSAGEEPGKLADARDLLTKALDRIQEIDPAHEIVSGEMVGQIETTLSTVESQVAQRVPLLYAEGKKLADQGKASKNLETLAKAEANWEAVAKLDPDYQSITSGLQQLKDYILSLSTEEILSEAQRRIDSARKALEEIQQALLNEDYEAFQEVKARGIEDAAFVRALQGDGRLNELKNEATKLETELRQKQFPPPVTDWELVKILERPTISGTEHIAELHQKGTAALKTVHLREGQTDPASKLTVVEVDKEEKAFVWVKKPDNRRTKLEKR